MDRKITFSTELAWVFGIVFTAFGVALMEKPDFGVSMVVAPAYILHLKLVTRFSFFTFGTAEYVFQFLVLIAMIPVTRRFRWSWLLSFGTAVIYGFTLDFFIALVSRIPADTMYGRLVMYACGILMCAAGISLMFHTYLPPEVYELFVKEVSGAFNVNINKFKTGYDIVSMASAIVMSFCFFGLWHFEGIKAGTVVCAMVNGFIIGCFSRLYEHFFVFRDSFPALAGRLR